jgi:carboxyl-terminal processing protease
MQTQPKSNSPRNWQIIFLQIVIVTLAFAVGFFAHRYITRYRGDFALLQQAQNIVVDNTILDLPSETDMEYGMIQGMMGSLNDPYSIFVPPAAHEVETDTLTGTFGGIGARLERDIALNWRVYPLRDSPALAAGIKDGDILLQVNELLVTKDNTDIDLLAAIHGPVGEPVDLLVQRGDKQLSFTILRETVPAPSVAWNLVPEAPTIGLLHVFRIAETTAQEITDGINDLQIQGAAAFILDLRDNGGGLVDAGVDIASLFLTDGEIIHRQFRDEDVEILTVDERGPFADLPLVLLINGNTASSAEIVTGALTAQGRAPIVGAPTYGKTTIQYVFDLEDGSSIHVTSGRWWVPGVVFPLQPDVLISDDPTGTATVNAALEILYSSQP